MTASRLRRVWNWLYESVIGHMVLFGVLVAVTVTITICGPGFIDGTLTLRRAIKVLLISGIAGAVGGVVVWPFTRWAREVKVMQFPPWGTDKKQ